MQYLFIESVSEGISRVMSVVECGREVVAEALHNLAAAYPHLTAPLLTVLDLGEFTFHMYYHTVWQGLKYCYC